MSRHNFFPKNDDSSYVVVVGWDEGLQSFFLQYGDPGSELPLILATGQRVAEHPNPAMVVALARHLGDRIPDDLAQTLEGDRKGFGDADIPDDIMLTTQGNNGAQIGFTIPRDAVPDIDQTGLIADHIISGDAERAMRAS
ncbi:hypothetical protein BH10PSE12_BH10PSE12_07540 [soil metagenome]